MNESDDFHLLFRLSTNVLDRAILHSFSPLEGSVERLFLPRYDLRFVYPLYCSSRASGKGRDIFTKSMRLYESFQAAPGAGKDKQKPFFERYALMKSVLATKIENGRVPTRQERSGFFGDTTST